MTPAEPIEVARTKRALQRLFGEEIDVAESLRRLEMRALREAFKARALMTHPDRAGALGREASELAAEFGQVRRARDWLEALLGDSARRRSIQRALNGTSRGGYHAGPMPRRPLRFAEFLYYSRLVPRREVIRAVRWQASRRPRLGELAMAWGRLGARDAAAIERARRPWERYGECAVRTGALSPFWVRVLLRRQRALDRPIGAYFVEHGVLDEATLARALELQRRHNDG